MPSTDLPCDDCAHYQRCKHELLACSAFTGWVYAGRTPSSVSREPDREAFVELFRFDDLAERYRVQRERETRERRAAKLEAMRQQARRETFERKRLIAAGMAAPLSKAARRKIQLTRRRLRWKIDPSLRERYLQLKREDAIRRGRRRGAAPKGSEANRLHRIESQRRRRQAEREREGRTMTGPQFRQFRQQLGLLIREIAERFGVTYSAAKQWQRSCGPPAEVERWLRSIEHEREKVPASPQPSRNGDAGGVRLF